MMNDILYTVKYGYKWCGLPKYFDYWHSNYMCMDWLGKLLFLIVY